MLYSVKPAKFGLVDNLYTLTDQYGKQTRHYDGVTVAVNARDVYGMTLPGGIDTSRTAEDVCDVRANLPEFTFHGPQGPVGGVSLLAPWCHMSTPLQTSLNGLATYTIPRVDIQVAGTWSSRPVAAARGSQTLVPHEALAANGIYTTAQIAPSLPTWLVAPATRPSTSSGRASCTGDRLNNLDFRVARVQRFGSRGC